MTDENKSDTEWRSPHTTENDFDGSKPLEYQGWSEKRLVDAYRRNSVLLREYGVDERIVRTLCAIEERLRARDIDPDSIVQELTRELLRNGFGPHEEEGEEE